MPTIILQPHIPHYREDFFHNLSKNSEIKIYCYKSNKDVLKENFSPSNIKFNRIKSYSLGFLLWYNPLKLTKNKNYDLVLMLDFKHISTWLLLITKFIHKRKIILWGQGISIKRYLKHEQKIFLILKLMLSLADGVWFYTEKELAIWKKRIPKLNAISLNNTISGIEEILNLPLLPPLEKKHIKEKYNIHQPIILIFCARFTAERKINLLLEVIESLDPNRFGFIIIGEGPYKPSFKKFLNVYDFGKLYNINTKNDLFRISDIYFQPAWLGLSVVEAMGYGKPVFSFKRSKEIAQCVEYHYVRDNYNGKLFSNSSELISYLNNMSMNRINTLSINARNFAESSLKMELMVNRALHLLKN